MNTLDHDADSTVWVDQTSSTTFSVLVAPNSGTFCTLFSFTDPNLSNDWLAGTFSYDHRSVYVMTSGDASGSATIYVAPNVCGEAAPAALGTVTLGGSFSAWNIGTSEDGTQLVLYASPGGPGTDYDYFVDPVTLNSLRLPVPCGPGCRTDNAVASASGIAQLPRARGRLERFLGMPATLSPPESPSAHRRSVHP
jgi:hypothetical protein